MGVPKMDEATKRALYASPTFDSAHAAAVLISTDFLPEFTEKFLDLTLNSDLHSQNYILYLPAIEAIATKLNLLPDEHLLNLLISKPLDSYHLSRILDHHPALLEPLLKAVESDPSSTAWALIPLARSRHLCDEQSVRVLELSLVRAPDGSWTDKKLGADLDDHPVVIRSIANHPCANIPARLAAARWSLEHIHDRNIVGITHRDYLNLQEIIEELTFAPELSELRSPWSALSEDTTHRALVKRAVTTFGAQLYPTLAGIPYLTSPEREYPGSFSKHFIDSKLLPALTLGGGAAWDVFLSLTPGWEGSREELLEVTNSTLLR